MGFVEGSRVSVYIDDGTMTETRMASRVYESELLFFSSFFLSRAIDFIYIHAFGCGTE